MNSELILQQCFTCDEPVMDADSDFDFACDLTDISLATERAMNSNDPRHNPLLDSVML